MGTEENILDEKVRGDYFHLEEVIIDQKASKYYLYEED